MVANLVLVTYKYYVIVEMFTTLVKCFVPLYLILLDRISFISLLDYWSKFSKFISSCFVIYVVLYAYGFINYASVGFYSHMNSIILIYDLYRNRKNRWFTLLLLTVNLLIGLLIGSRMLFFATFTTGFSLVLFLSNKRGTRFYSKIILLSLLLIFLAFNAEGVLQVIDGAARMLGIKSRNLNLLIQQIGGAGLEEIGAGRSQIYETILMYIRNRSGLPGGLAVTRHLSNGSLYFAHNFILDFSLVFGVFGALAFFVWLIFRNINIFRVRHNDRPKYTLYLIMFVSFWTRSISGSYFVANESFWIIIAMIISGYGNQLVDKKMDRKGLVHSYAELNAYGAVINRRSVI